MSHVSVERPEWIGPDGQPMRRLEVHLSYQCPQQCDFCSEHHRMREHRSFEVTWGRIVRTLRLHRERGITDLHLTGGEPTVHPRFVDTLGLAVRLGLRTSISTNGAVLWEEEAAQAALPFLDEVMFSLHGPGPEIHDQQTGTPGSFERVSTAIRLCGEIKPTLKRFVNVVLTRANMDHLEATVALAESYGAGLVLISYPTPEGAAAHRYGELAVPLDELADRLPGAVRGAQRAVVRFFGVPLCLLGDHAMLSNDLHWDPRVTVEWIRKPGKVVYGAVYSWTPSRRRIHVEACQTCVQRSICAGVFDLAAQLWSGRALQPQQDSFGPGRAAPGGRCDG